MKERPILLSGEMVRAILDGRKTQTRRVMKIQPEDTDRIEVGEIGASRGAAYIRGDRGGQCMRVPCPFGQPGDRLWVRETWGIWTESWTDLGWEPNGLVNMAIPKNRPSDSQWERYSLFYKANDGYEPEPSEERWRPSIHMPRWASRITLEITDVRVERLNEISETDALREGVTGPHDVGYPVYRCPGDSKTRYSCAVAAFEALWESINGFKSLVDNPWVWVIEFKRIDAILNKGGE